MADPEEKVVDIPGGSNQPFIFFLNHIMCVLPARLQIISGFHATFQIYSRGARPLQSPLAWSSVQISGSIAGQVCKSISLFHYIRTEESLMV